MTQTAAPGVVWRPPRQRAPADPPRRRTGVPAIAGASVAAVDATALATAAALTPAPGWVVAGYLLAVLGLLAGGGRYRPRITLRLGDELPTLLGYALLPALLLVPYGGLATVATVAAAVPAGRLVSYAGLRAARRHGLLAEPTLIVGAGRLGCEIATALAAHPELGLVPYGFVDHRPPQRPVGVPWLGDIPALRQLVEAHRIGRIIVCRAQSPDAALVPVLRQVPGTRIHLVPRLYELGRAGGAATRDEVWGIPLVPLRRPSRVGVPLKRVFDVAVAGLLLVVLAPVLAVLAVLARVASGGPALFRQSRVTRDGRVVTMVKLRSLVRHPAGDAATDTHWAVPAERCTRLGRLLRTSHADELPQLVNVLRGEMSLVGPRPERPYFAALFADQFPGYAGRHRMRAGMTGWAQVHGLSGNTSVAERARFDNRYVEDWSPWLDLVILVRTLAALLPRRTEGPATGPATGTATGPATGHPTATSLTEGRR